MERNFSSYFLLRRKNKTWLSLFQIYQLTTFQSCLSDNTVCVLPFEVVATNARKGFFFLLTLFELERSRLSTENCWSSCLTCFCACVMKSTWQNFSSICKKSKSHNIAKINRVWLEDVIHDMKSIREALYLLPTKKKNFLTKSPILNERVFALFSKCYLHTNCDMSGEPRSSQIGSGRRTTTVNYSYVIVSRHLLLQPYKDW